MAKMREAANQCPNIKQFVDPNDPEARSKSAFWSLKEKVVELARDELDKEIKEARQIQDSDTKRRKKMSILSKLKRLTPGSKTSIGMRRDLNTISEIRNHQSLRSKIASN